MIKTQLVALKGKLYTKSFHLGEGEKLIVGRGQDADVQILDSSLSRKHCSLERDEESFTIEDLGSRNGTWVNGERIERRKLAAGDSVRFGGVEFEFRCEPERRRMSANLIASFPELPGHEVKERVEIDGSDLMQLPSQFQSIENYQRIQRDLATIYRVGNLISAEADIEKLHERILDAIFEVVNADRAFLIVADNDGELSVAAEREKKSIPGTAEGGRYSSTIARECLRDGISVLRANALADERYGSAESVIIQDIHSVMCVPVQSPEGSIGVLYTDTLGQCEAFAKHDLELLTAVGKQAGMAVHRARLSEQVRALLYGTVRALVATIEAKDDYTRGHSERVTAYAIGIGRAMGLDAARLRTLELAGLLHDVGKIGVPENILRKAGPLNDEEYAIVKQHPALGHGILINMEGAEEVADVVLHHHERYDGRGYPDGLAKDKTPELARILVVADAFDAMSSARPYRDRLAQEKVLTEIRRGAGSQFDPDIAKVFLDEIGAGRISLEMAEKSVSKKTAVAPGRSRS